MFELSELELVSVVGGGFYIKNINSRGGPIAIANLPTIVNHGQVFNSNTSSGNTILQNSPTYTNYSIPYSYS